MSLANNDYNWRLVAAVNIPENSVITINGAGKAALYTLATGQVVVGICPQACVAGERIPVIRGGKLGGIVGATAGQLLRPQAGSTLGTAGTEPPLAAVVSEDATNAVILSGNLDTVHA